MAMIDRLTLKLFLVLMILIFNVAELKAERLKDITSIKGVRENQLVGYGLVVGLQGSGDRSYKSPFTMQALISMLKRLGANVESHRIGDIYDSYLQSRVNNLRVDNVAAVMVTARLPAFAKAGQKIDIRISSLGDARSLESGQLLMTPLKGADQSVYAVAQSSIISYTTKDSENYLSKMRNGIRSISIPDGAIVEKEVDYNFLDQENLIFSVDYPDFATVDRAATAINQLAGADVAKAIDASSFVVSFPEEYKERKIEYLAMLEKIEIKTDADAKIVINERLGTIVIGSNVKVDDITISHKDMTIRIGKRASKDIVKGEFIDVEQKEPLSEIVKILGRLGVSTSEIVALFQALKQSGALKGSIEII